MSGFRNLEMSGSPWCDLGHVDGRTDEHEGIGPRASRRAGHRSAPVAARRGPPAGRDRAHGAASVPVERANRTLQDRLVKELRLQGISDIVAANDFLDAHFRDDFNRRFARAPESDLDAHRPLLLTAPLADIFQLQARRKVSRQLTVNYQRTLYVLEKTDSARATMGKHVMLYEDDAGRVTIRTEAGGELRAEAFDRVPKTRIQPGDVVDNKLLGRALEVARQQQVDTENERVEHSRTKRERRLAAARLAAAATG